MKKRNLLCIMMLIVALLVNSSALFAYDYVHECNDAGYAHCCDVEYGILPCSESRLVLDEKIPYALIDHILVAVESIFNIYGDMMNFTMDDMFVSYIYISHVWEMAEELENDFAGTRMVCRCPSLHFAGSMISHIRDSRGICHTIITTTFLACRDCGSIRSTQSSSSGCGTPCRA